MILTRCPACSSTYTVDEWFGLRLTAVVRNDRDPHLILKESRACRCGNWIMDVSIQSPVDQDMRVNISQLREIDRLLQGVA